MALALADFGVRVSPSTVARLLHQMGYSLRVNHKQLATDHSPDRNHQFLYLGDLRDRFARRGLPIISVDTKKRELVGPFKNSGTGWDLSPRLVNDHDFRSDSTGVAIPYGIYDLLANLGSVVVHTSECPKKSDRFWKRLSVPQMDARGDALCALCALLDTLGEY